MGQWDNAATDFGIPETLLMENAGRAIAEAAQERFGSFKGRTVCLFMGGGNNGGDAACVARYVQDAGGQAIVSCLKTPETLKGAPAWHAALAQADGAIFSKLDQCASAVDFLTQFTKNYGKLPDVLVDGLLGTGFSGSLKPETAGIIAMLNDLSALLKCPVLAADIPSGLNSFSGQPSPIAVKASLTVTLAAPKPGLLLPQAKAWTGDIVCRPIGIPKVVLEQCPANMLLLDGGCLDYAPPAPAKSFKNVYGHVFVFGGARGYAGAAHLACAAALRAGCGLVTACAPETSLTQIKAGWPEIMTVSVNAGVDWPQALPEDLAGMIAAASALVVGPGMGRTEDAAKFMGKILAVENRPQAVIDADALVNLAKNPDLWRHISEKDVLTPHPGEAAMLLGCAGKDVQMDRFAALDRLCALSPAVVVLKGAATLIGQSDGKRLLCPYDIPQLAIGGAGDVLAGCIGALLGSKLYAAMSSTAKAGLGVAIHAIAGLYCARNYPDRGVIASQLADAIARARHFAQSEAKPANGLLPWPR